MRLRDHPLALLAVALLFLGAGTGVWRSAAPRTETAGTIAAGLLCPACQGESVAQSQSPMAAAMRDTIAQQLAAGRSPDQVRQWFVDRYGAQILTDPPHGGLGVLLWLIPAAALLILAVLFARVLRRRAPAGSVANGAAADGAAAHGAAADGAATTGSAPDGPTATGSATDGPTATCSAPDGSAGDGSAAAGDKAPPSDVPPSRRLPRPAWNARRTWDAVAVGVIALVGTVALAAPHRGSDTGTATAAPASGTTLLELAQSLELQGRYPEAAQVYREVVQQQPGDDRTRLRLALTLLRSDQPAEAADNAQQVLNHAPGDAEALLMLGLAQRATGSGEAAGTLRRFLAAAPHDPAAAEVRRLLNAP
jgi:cytochrome c-type biogenesis protein CcmH